LFPRSGRKPVEAGKRVLVSKKRIGAGCVANFAQEMLKEQLPLSVE
jgi:hypothetical protein